ncbi:MAG: TraR/DksA family transcriptional regulator [Patescibacteria group bacterium]
MGYLGSCNGGKAEDIPVASTNPGDFGDRGSHQQEGFRASALNANRSQLCSQVESALGRIESGRYSDKCAVCGQPIPLERLMATPWAVTHVRRDGKCVLGIVPVED